MSIADVLRRLLEANDINQASLARIAGVSDATVSLWLSNVRKPSIDALQRISEHFGVSSDELLGMSSAKYLSADAPKKAYMPLYGRVHAGTVQEPDIVEHDVPVPYEVWRRHRGAILLEVEGDCMSRVLPPGCLVIVDKTMQPSSGSIVVAALDNEYVIRRYSRGANTLMLSPDSYNQDWQDIVITDDTVELVGVVVWYQPREELT